VIFIYTLKKNLRSSVLRFRSNYSNY